jgi:hypothetical protein
MKGKMNLTTKIMFGLVAGDYCGSYFTGITGIC